MTASFIAAEHMAMRIRRIRLPQSGKDWVLLGIMIVVIAAGTFFGKRIFPNLKEKTLNTIVVVIGVLVLLIGGYGD